MARPLRLEFAGALYHVTSRGDRREDIYVDDVDRQDWLSVLALVCERFNWVVHAYCQMTNHYHALIETVDGNLSRGMRQLNAQFGTQRSRARRAYANFVAQGKGLASPLLGTKHQLLLSDEKFIETHQVPLKREQLRELSIAHRRSLALSLRDYQEQHADRNEAMAAAYRSGAYTMAEIANFFGVHYMTVSRAVRAVEE